MLKLRAVRPIHSSCAAAAALATLAALPVAAQQAPAPQVQPSSFTLFVRGQPVGNEEIGVVQTPQGWTITSTGRVNSPLDIVARSFQLRYDGSWKAIDFRLDATVRGQTQDVRGTVTGTTINTE